MTAMREPIEPNPPHWPAIVSWARSAIVPKGGAFNALQPHEIAAPLVHALLAQAGLGTDDIDAVVLGNALGAGGNPARMTALAAGLSPRCAAFSIDSQCCAGLDAIGVAAGLIHSGQADVVIAGGVEAWSRAPIRQTRPLHEHEAPQTYERPPFAPDPAQDPDLLQAACDHAFAQGVSRTQQDTYALLSHKRAQTLHMHSQCDEIVPIAGVNNDAYPRHISPERAARMPVIAHAAGDTARESGLTALTISAKADGAAVVLLASQRACERLHLKQRAHWIASAMLGGDSRMPLSAAALAASKALATAAVQLQRDALLASQLQAIELHDAFAVQGISFCDALGLKIQDINTGGGGLARGHPIGASGAVALVRLLATLDAQRSAAADTDRTPLPLTGMAAIAGAGGLGAACIVRMGNMENMENSETGE